MRFDGVSEKTLGSDVLLVHQNMRPILPMLQAHHRVHCLWEHADRESFLIGHGPSIGVIVTAGENRVDPALVEHLPGLGMIICVGAGYDGVDVAHARARGVATLAAIGANADDVGDYALGLAIAAWRGIVADDRIVRGGGWLATNRLPTRSSMTGATAGIVGLGAVGKAVARRLRAIGMEVSWWGPREQLGVDLVRAPNLLALAETSRLLVICCRADAASNAIIDAPVLDALGSDGVLVNVSRGSVVDEDAVIAALKDRRLGAAALDVFATEPAPTDRWADVPNTVLTPHAAGLTTDTLQRMISLAVGRVSIFLTGDEPQREALLRERIL